MHPFRNLLLITLGRETSFEKDPKPDGWKRLYQTVCRQAMVGTLNEGVHRLPAHQMPPEDLLKEWDESTEKIARIYHRHEEHVKELETLLGRLGLHGCILKGTGLAHLYPNPERRMCGDIDLFVFPEDYTRAARLLATCLEQIEMATEKHGTFRRGRYNVELHFCPLVLQRPWLRHHFDLYTREKLSDVHETLSLPFAEGKVLVPPVTYNAIFLLAHIYHHFIEGGIGLRQICDWTLFLDRNFERLDVDELATKLEQFGLMNAWKVFVSLAVGFLGLKRDRAPFYDADEHYARKAEEILTIILKEGNFGRYGKGELAKKKDDSYSTKKSKSFKLGLQRLKCRIPIFPLDTLLFFPKWASESLFRLFKKR